MKTELVIGKILRPRGLKGEMKIEIYSSKDIADSVEEVRIDGVPYSVLKFTQEGTFGYIVLDGIDSADAAEALRNKYAYAPKSSLPPLGDGEYYIDDLIGLKVVVDGEELGRIDDVLQYGAADVYMVKGKRDFSFPALKKLILSVDLENQKMLLDKSLFDSVVVYN